MQPTLGDNIKETLHASNLDFLDCHTVCSTYGLHHAGAKFPPQLPRWMISHLSKPGELSVDPFSGNKTTLVKERLLNRKVGGGDVNHLAERGSPTNSTPPDIGELTHISETLEQHLQTSKQLLEVISKTRLLTDIPPAKLSVNGNEISVPDFCGRDCWFAPRIPIELALITYRVAQTTSPELRQFLEAVFSSCIMQEQVPLLMQQTLAPALKDIIAFEGKVGLD